MRAVIFKTQNGVFKFDQKEVKEQIILKKSTYDTDEADKLLSLISADLYKIIRIPEEPVYFDHIAMDLIGAGKGSAFCKTCNKPYTAGQLISTKVGYGGSPFDIVNDRPNGATHVRGNGATLKWQIWGSRRASKLAFFTPFRNNIFYDFSAADQRQLLSPLNDN